MLNVVIMSGRLVAEPEIRTTNNGKKVSSFRIAVDAGKDANGNKKADFFDCVAWEHNAEFLGKNAHKGYLVTVEGKLQTRSYQDKNGNNRTAVEIVANNVNFAAPKSSNPNAGGHAAPAPAADYSRPAAQPAAPSYSAGTNDDFALIEDEGDLPF